MPTGSMPEDEYDAIPDDFGDIDFDRVPALSVTTPPTPSSSFPAPTSPMPGRLPQDDGSSEYGFDDDLDPNTLEALDAFEQTLVGSRVSGMRDQPNSVYVSHIPEVFQMLLLL